MNQIECKTWWNDYQAKFPSAGKWAAALSDDQWREVFGAWSALLGPTPLEDALEVNRLMRSGAIAEVGSFDHEREKIGHAVRSEADALERSRRPRYKADWEAERYKCRHCRDTGLVEVFRGDWLSWLSRQDAIPGGMKAAFDAGWRRGRPSRMVLCRCEASDAMTYHGIDEKAPKLVSKSRINPPDDNRFSSERFYLIPLARDMSPEEWAKAVSWWLDGRDRVTGNRVYDEFEAWNAQGYAPSDLPAPRVEFKRP